MAPNTSAPPSAQVASRYHADVPYHNWQHAFDTAQTAFCLVRRLG
jgi:hypothetical protein